MFLVVITRRMTELAFVITFMLSIWHGDIWLRLKLCAMKMGS